LVAATMRCPRSCPFLRLFSCLACQWCTSAALQDLLKQPRLLLMRADENESRVATVGGERRNPCVDATTSRRVGSNIGTGWAFLLSTRQQIPPSDFVTQISSHCRTPKLHSQSSYERTFPGCSGGSWPARCLGSTLRFWGLY